MGILVAHAMDGLVCLAKLARQSAALMPANMQHLRTSPQGTGEHAAAPAAACCCALIADQAGLLQRQARLVLS